MNMQGKINRINLPLRTGIRIAFAGLFVFLVMWLAPGSALAAAPATLDWICENQTYYVSIDPEDVSVEVTQYIVLTLLPETTDQVTIDLSLENVDIISAGVKHRLPGGTFTDLDVTQAVVTEEGELTIYFEPALHRYDTIRIHLKYISSSPSSLRFYTEGDTRYCEFALTVKSDTELEQLLITMNVPKGYDWRAKQVVPYTASGRYGTRSVNWNIAPWGPGQQSFKMVLPSLEGTGTGTEPSEPPPVWQDQLKERLAEMYANPETLRLIGSILVLIVLIVTGIAVFFGRNVEKVWMENRGDIVERLIRRAIGRLLGHVVLDLALKNLTRKKGRLFLICLGMFIAAAIFASQFFAIVAMSAEPWMAEIVPHLYAILAITLLICFFCVFSTMLCAVSERTQEIGTMKAVGISSSWVMRLFIIEALFLGLISGATGSLSGFLIAVLPHVAFTTALDPFIGVYSFLGGLAATILILLLSKSRLGIVVGFMAPVLFPAIAVGWQASFQIILPVALYVVPGILAASLGFVILVAVAGGFYPSWKAARVHPAEALK